ncbi:MAG TPA: rhomboid family intramembrane serine protease [Gammaproteobacteria bacterium]|nr:rhomboid family intramembrane serine protease [Gammaproteobacteria bacterium]
MDDVSIKNLPAAFYLVAFMWLLQVAQMLLPGDLSHFGILPRHLSGLIGIPLAPWIHHGWMHLISNSIPFLVLGTLLQYSSKGNFWDITIILAVVGGLGTWLLGSAGYHAGASGLIFSYWAYLLADAYYSRSIKSALIAVVVFLLYGGLVFSLLDFRPQISWVGHASGMVAGVLVARYVSRKEKRSL